MTIVKFDQVTKKFGDVTAVDKVSLEIQEERSSRTAGPNGADKSTAINMITGLLSIDKGSIGIYGKDVRKDKMTTRSYAGIVPRT